MRHPLFECTTLAAFVTASFAILAPASAQVINEDFKLLASDGAAFDEFGYSISINDGLAAVGARMDDDNAPNSGSAYLFDASNGVQIRKLRATDADRDDWFGFSIAIDDGIVAVGAPLEDSNNTFAGSVYLFDAFTGTQLFKLLPTDGAAGDSFGWSVAIENGVVAVGAYFDDDNGNESGSAYLFDAATGVQIAKLLPTDGAAGDRFGQSISIDSGIVAVGAPLDDDNGGNSGSAYLFDAATGDQLFRLLPGDGALSDEFGTSIAIDNDIVAVGSYRDDDNGFDSGSAYLFDATTGLQIAKLLPTDGAENDWFGCSVAIDSGVVAVGARYDDDNGDKSGAAYLFNASTGDQIAKLLPTDGATADEIGNAIAINNGTIAAAAYHDSDSGMWCGSAYLFTAPAGIQLALTSSCPNGGPIQVTWTGATSNGTAVLLYARNTGSFVIPNNRPCAGTTLGLGANQLQIVFTGPSDANGARTINSTAPQAACGDYLQLLDLTTCDTSNVATIQ